MANNEGQAAAEHKPQILTLQNQLDAERSRNQALERELETEKMKNQGMQLLFDCMQEGHAENRQLRSLLKRHKLILRKVKKRLQTNPNIGFQINWDELSDLSDVEDSPDSGMRSSKSRIQSTGDKEYHSVQTFGMEMKISKEAELDDLTKRVKDLISENEQLTGQLTSSGSEKDAEILRLKKQILELEKSRKVSGILCDTLSDEALTLKRHLAETVGMCQKLMHTLEMKQDFTVNAMPEKISSESIRNVEDDEKSLSMLKQQYIALELKLKEVVTMNSRWQQYNEQREEYVQQLLQRNVELEQALVNRGMQLSLAQQEHFDQILMEHKQKLNAATEEKMIVEKENNLLKTRHEEMQLLVRKKSLEVQDLHKKLEFANFEHNKAIHAVKESNEALKLQMQTFQEDFESERSDRERAQAHISKLEMQIRTASQQLSLNNLRNGSEQVLRPYDERQFMGQQSFHHEASLVGRGSQFTVSGEDKSDSGELDLRPTID